MAHFYTEPVRREPNRYGRPRLVTVLGNLPGAVGHGFDGNGTPTGATVRLGEFANALRRPLPAGVTKLSKSMFDNCHAARNS